MTGKVFCVGLQRTGTTSLGAALEVLGFRVCGAVGTWLPDIRSRASALAREIVPRYDAFEDNPWPLLVEELDAAWPDARFVLTVRDAGAWVRSVRSYFTGQQSPMEEWLYGPGGVPAADDATLATLRARHDASVRTRFANRPSQLLVLDVDAGLSWEPLCSFLGRPVPAVPFPRLNSGAVREDGPVALRSVQPTIV